MAVASLSMISLSPREAGLSCLYIAARVDGPMSDTDHQLMQAVIASTPALSGGDSDVDQSHFQRLQDLLDADEGLETVLELIEATPANGEVLYALTVEFIVRRGRISAAEMRLLDILASRFNLAPLTRAAIDTATRIRMKALD